jgi:hypothetical protein
MWTGRATAAGCTAIICITTIRAGACPFSSSARSWGSASWRSASAITGAAIIGAGLGTAAKTTGCIGRRRRGVRDHRPGRIRHRAPIHRRDRGHRIARHRADPDGRTTAVARRRAGRAMVIVRRQASPVVIVRRQASLGVIVRRQASLGVIVRRRAGPGVIVRRRATGRARTVRRAPPPSLRLARMTSPHRTSGRRPDAPAAPTAKAVRCRLTHAACMIECAMLDSGPIRASPRREYARCGLSRSPRPQA